MQPASWPASARRWNAIDSRKRCALSTFHIPDSAVYNCLIGRLCELNLCYQAVQIGTHQLDAVSTFVVIVAGLHDTIDASKRAYCVTLWS